MHHSDTHIITELKHKLSFQVGRHLYAAIGSYEQVTGFKRQHLASAQFEGSVFPSAHNLNYELLTRMDDARLRVLVANEAKRPITVAKRLQDELAQFLDGYFRDNQFLILDQLEILFTYPLDLSIFRQSATNQNHILLLLPAEKRGDQTILFHQADPKFQRTLPENLIAHNHIWEITEYYGEAK